MVCEASVPLMRSFSVFGFFWNRKRGDEQLGMVCEDKTPHAAGSSQIGGGTRAGHGMRGRSAPRAAWRPVGRREEGCGVHPFCALGPSLRIFDGDVADKVPIGSTPDGR